jgi:hypothetical protein
MIAVNCPWSELDAHAVEGRDLGVARSAHLAEVDGPRGGAVLGGGRRRGSAGRHLAAPGAEGFLLSCLTVRHPSISIFGVKTGLLPILVAVGSTGFPTLVALRS